MAKWKLSRTSAHVVAGVHEKLQKISERALEISPMDFGYPRDGGLRTSVDQRDLYDRGLSKLDGTNKKSKHQTGRALDVFAFINGQASWDKPHLAVVVMAHMQAANELGIRLKSALLWENMTDWPHMELHDSEE
jgi:peptidoglycan L-alanyl-D-glutamate endopeptidase CwlK